MPQVLEATGLEVVDLFRISPGSGAPWEATHASFLLLQPDGIEGDRHAGMIRTVRSYESADLAGNNVLNDKQLSVVEVNDVLDIGFEMDLPLERIAEGAVMDAPSFMAAVLGANILVDSTQSRRLNDIAFPGAILASGLDGVPGAAMRVTEYNRPCHQPVENLLHSLGEIGIDLKMEADVLVAKFRQEADKRRGWVGSVYMPGTIHIGDELYRHKPVTL